jgi:hypothetical protein
MACCAFAIFLLSQLLLPLQCVRDFLFGQEAERDNPAVAWTFGASTVAIATTNATRGRGTARAVAIALTAELLLVAGAFAVVTDDEASPQTNATGMSDKTYLDALHRSICRSIGIASQPTRQQDTGAGQIAERRPS